MRSLPATVTNGEAFRLRISCTRTSRCRRSTRTARFYTSSSSSVPIFYCPNSTLTSGIVLTSERSLRTWSFTSGRRTKCTQAEQRSLLEGHRLFKATKIIFRSCELGRVAVIKIAWSETHSAVGTNTRPCSAGDQTNQDYLAPLKISTDKVRRSQIQMRTTLTPISIAPKHAPCLPTRQLFLQSSVFCQTTSRNKCISSWFDPCMPSPLRLRCI